MNNKTSLKILSITLLTLTSSYAFSHGLMTNPPARNAICGLASDQRPDNATNPACIEAFSSDRDGGYQFMSVLTHDVGRKGVDPLPQNVCGFNSETWDGKNNITPWDTPTNWPTTAISSGSIDIKWDIQWGPHFDDTQEFVYYITKPGFQFQVGTPLKWSDFESEPFCDLSYNDTSPGENANVIPNKTDASFITRCNVPSRSGRHVIYGEWGRNYYTYERFHGCLDVTFGGGGSTNNLPSANPLSVSVQANGNVAITLSGVDSDGTIVGYDIVDQPTQGSLSGSGANHTYTPNTGFAGSDSFTFRVVDDDGGASATATVSISVLTDTGDNNIAPQADFSVSKNLLSVSFDAGASTDPDSGPQALSYTWDFGDGNTGSGENVNHTYSAAGAYSVSLIVSDGEDSDQASETVSVNTGGGNGGLACAYVISNSWSTGFVAEIRLTNNGTSAVSGWDVSWNYNDGSQITNSWNASVSGSGPYSASNLSWNATIEPGQSTTFGFQGNNSGAAQIPQVTGDKCE